MAPSLKAGGSYVEAGLNYSCSKPLITRKGSNFTADGHVILSDVPSNVVSTPSPHKDPDMAETTAGRFVGFDADKPKSRHLVPIGKLKGIAFVSIYRFQVWWTTHKVGSRGRDLENETKMVILQNSDSGRPYVLLLTLLEGPFRASLQPGDGDNVDVCVESGSTKVVEDSFRSVLYMHAGDNPYSLVKEGMRVARLHLESFKLLEEKTPPPIVDKFGWCTWDAFSPAVHPQGVWEGVKGLADGGCPPGVVLMDDGWQSIEDGVSRRAVIEQMGCRPISFSENDKFRDYMSQTSEDRGMGAFVRDLKKEFPSVDYVYAWHPFCAYRAGLQPNDPALPGIKVVVPKLSPSPIQDLVVDKIVDNRMGLVPPDMVGQMYEGLHSHLESLGIDGVKVDVIHLLEMMGEDYGGRVELAKAYCKPFTSSVRAHFKGHVVIATMGQGNEFMFLGTKAISLGLAGDDIYCTGYSKRTSPQRCHLVHCAYNSLWMGNFIQPDWDMFQSTSSWAEFHAASRAISGGPIYVSDSIGNHDFPLLCSLVLPDGSTLPCRYHALPTRDCLFQDPLYDGKTILKIWNLNSYTGVIGAFNCQGGVCCKQARSNTSTAEHSRLVTSKASPSDVEWKQGAEPISVEGVSKFAVYRFRGRKLELPKSTGAIEVSLEPFDFELMTVSAVRVITSKSIKFAPIGLVNMLNSGGAVQSLAVEEEAGSVKVGVKGSGEMRVFASKMPRACLINGEEVEFEYEKRMVVVQVAWPHPSGFSVIEYLF